MRLLAALAALSLPAWAGDWSLEQLYQRPYVWGTAPEQAKWTDSGHTLAFLWNADGNRFLDLYAYHAGRGERVRLTKLESAEIDDLNRTEAEKEEIRKRYVPPQSGISGFHLSPDGARAAFSWRGDVYVVATDGKTPPFRLTRTKSAESSPKLSPDAARLAYLRDGQLVVHNLKNGQIWQVTEIEGASNSLQDYHWSPDGRRFVYVVERGTERKLVLPNFAGRFVTAREFSRSVAGDPLVDVAIFVVSSEGGKPREMEAGPMGAKVWISEPQWSPDSKKLLYRAVHADMKMQQILVVDPETGKPAVVFEETDEKWVYWSTVGWSPDAGRIFFVSERDGWAHLYTVPSAGGKPEQATRGAWEVSLEPFTFDPQWIGDYLYYSSTEGGPSERHFYRIRPDGSGKQKLSTREGLNAGLVSKDGEHTAWQRADLDQPLDLYVGDMRVTQSPTPKFREYAWPETRFVTFPSRADKTVSAKILLPPGYRLEDKTQKPRPAVFFIHGAGYATSVLKQWGSYNVLRFVYNCYLANKGYVVLDLDYRGSSGYGRDWRTDIYLHMGGRDLDDVLGGVDFLQSLGNIDMRRLGIWGVSYGGFMTNMAMFLSPDTFRAGSSWAAVNDWENYNAYYTTQRLNTPRRNPEAYRRSSPIHFSSNLKNPLLIVHGMVDSNVLFQDAVQLTEKLIHEGKDFSHIYYPEEDHGFVRDETWIDALRRTTEWFQRHLR